MTQAKSLIHTQVTPHILEKKKQTKSLNNGEIRSSVTMDLKEEKEEPNELPSLEELPASSSRSSSWSRGFPFLPSKTVGKRKRKRKEGNLRGG